MFTNHTAKAIITTASAVVAAAISLAAVAQPAAASVSSDAVAPIRINMTSVSDTRFEAKMNEITARLAAIDTDATDAATAADNTTVVAAPAANTTEDIAANAVAEAARLGVTITWGGTQGAAGAFSQAEPGVIRVNPEIVSFGNDTTISVVRHEAAHNTIMSICGTATPTIAGSTTLEVEQVTDAYADMFLGGTSFQSYGYDAADAAIATSIHAGNCN